MLGSAISTRHFGDVVGLETVSKAVFPTCVRLSSHFGGCCANFKRRDYLLYVPYRIALWKDAYYQFPLTTSIRDGREEKRKQALV